ncbi:MAG: alpha/beta hydrolase [Bacteroidota bacterium]|nr:alpha/beta hydrolase [Bacteroidota bacterium]MDP3144249.1 alpha/beta hydrolase [Bacteroidota bacterium]
METIILTHGAIGSKADLNKLEEALLKENNKVLSFSFSGHGNTDFETNFDIEQFTLEFEQFIFKNNLIQPSVIGYSMGGYVALNLARRSPSNINKIVTLGTKFNWNKEVVDKEIKMLDPEVMQNKVPAFAKALEVMHGKNWKELLSKTAELMKDISLKNYLNSESLRTIQNKTLVCVGDRDQMVTFEETVGVYKILPNANMCMLPNTKHPIQQLNVDLFAQIVRSFLES